MDATPADSRVSPVRSDGVEHADLVVVGGGVGGLLAAAAAARHLDDVVVVDRDTLPEDLRPRGGTPQDRHTHGLLVSGREAMERLLPGLVDELKGLGAVSSGDIGSAGRWYVGGHALAPCELGRSGLGVSRPTLEGVLRRRVRALPQVRVVDGTAVEDLLGGHRRVHGIRCRRQDTEARLEMRAPFVVDASGRAGGATERAARVGIRFREDVVHVDVRYRTVRLEQRAGDLDGRMFAVVAATPSAPRMGVALSQEDGTWVLTLGGVLGDQAPDDLDGMRRFAATLASDDLARLLADREPLGPSRAFRIPRCVRRRQVGAVPGYLPMGDALCALDPVFGQGMSVAALQALALDDVLARGGRVERSFARRAQRAIDPAWTLSTGADLQIPGVRGRRPVGHAVSSRWSAAVQRAASTDPAVAAALLRTTNLLAPVSSLLAPGVVRRVLAAPAPPFTSTTTRVDGHDGTIAVG